MLILCRTMGFCRLILSDSGGSLSYHLFLVGTAGGLVSPGKHGSSLIERGLLLGETEDPLSGADGLKASFCFIVCFGLSSSFRPGKLLFKATLTCSSFTLTPNRWVVSWKPAPLRCWAPTEEELTMDMGLELGPEEAYWNLFESGDGL